MRSPFVTPSVDTPLQQPPSTKDLPHITWCTTGPLAFLPLHAAGCYDEPQARVFDFTISSYTPTISSLLKPIRTLSGFSGILAVGQATTSGCAPLPGTVEELDRIQEQASDVKFTRIDGDSATSASVLSAMQNHSWVHLACHAAQNLSEPLASAFHLHGSQLSLETIAQHSLKAAELAFLSACQTAQGDEKLPEEAVHLAAGMIMAGYSTVIGTMWSIKDEDAPVVAASFYSRLLEGGVPDSQKAARALHDAVTRLRDKVGDKSFARWVPFIHMGQ
jgi:CHAT domain-containing protein